MNSKRKGNIAVGRAISYFISSGITVLIPVSDCDKYDIAIGNNGVLKRVQCKYSSAKEPSGAYIVDLRTFGGYKDKTYHIKYTKEDFDYLFIYCSNGDEYLIPADQVISKLHISLGIKSWTNYKCNAGLAEQQSHLAVDEAVERPPGVQVPHPAH